MKIKDKLLDIQYAIENWYNAKQMTVVEMLVFVVLLCFLVVQSAEAKTTKHKHKHPHVERVTQTHGMSIIHVDLEQDSIIKGQNIQQVRALASITKLMTAVVALDYTTDMDKLLMLSNKAGSKLPRREYTRGELFHAMLIKSDNGAAETIAADYPGGRDKFISDMNIRAMAMGLKNTRFNDPTGLSSGNVSTAEEVSHLVVGAAFYPMIRDVSTKKESTILIQVKHKDRPVVLSNTNRVLLREFDSILLSKTGFTNPAGFCVAILIEHPVKNEIRHQVIVVMGAKNTTQRVDTVKRMMYHVMYGGGEYDERV
jgi:serine-type D-Ala-D-Ala endopeptidase (penicillin-binding protein 7)